MSCFVLFYQSELSFAALKYELHQIFYESDFLESKNLSELSTLLHAKIEKEIIFLEKMKVKVSIEKNTKVNPTFGSYIFQSTLAEIFNFILKNGFEAECSNLLSEAS